jgi:flagellar hook protein FlgE
MAHATDRRHRGDWLSVGNAVFCASLVGCGGALSTDERWGADADARAPLGSPGPECPAATHPAPSACADEHLPGYRYAEGEAFWLGSQAARSITVRGAGFFVSDDATTAQHAARFSRQASLSVGPDGALEDDGGHALLGYAPGTTVGGDCVVRLVAPLFAPPEATTRLDIRVNLDARSAVTIFDILDPSGTSNSSTSFFVVDSIGAQHILDMYFTNLGGNLHEYYVVADGGDLAGGTPGTFTLLGMGVLQFGSDGALWTETAPPLDVSFVGGATAAQAIYIDFGPDITTDGSSGWGGSTGFASETVVSAQQADGFVAGTGSDLRIAPSGEVTIDFDSGAWLEIGRLALARFANEDRLAVAGDGTVRATPESRPAQFGAPSSPGRGVLEIPRD